MKTAPLTPPLTVASEGWLGDRLRQFDEMVRGEAVAAKVLAARELAEATSTQQGVLDLIGYLRDANPDGDWSTYQRLVQRVGDAPDEVVAMFGLGGEWAASGAAERGAGIALQLACAQVFDGSDAVVSAWADPASLESATGFLDEVGDGVRIVLSTAYARTQEFLAPVDGLIAYRGVGSCHVDADGRPSLLPLSSWSLNPAVAAEFPFTLGRSRARRLLMAFVPRSRVFGVPQTGFASLGEQEIAVITARGVEDRVLVFESPPTDALGISQSACWAAARSEPPAGLTSVE